jgi:mono/diheme cytochrome c family protein
MTLLHATILALSLLPSAALKAPPIPTPGPASASSEARAPIATRLPAGRQSQYELFSQKCGRCHAAERALGAGFTADEWDAYLRRKYRRAGAGISREQLEQINAFLRYWSTRPAAAR